MIGREGSLLSVIRYPSKDDATNKDLHNNMGTSIPGGQKNPIQILSLCHVHVPTDTGVGSLCVSPERPGLVITLTYDKLTPQLYPNFEQLLHSRSIKKENSLDVSPKHDSLVIINIQKSN